MGGGCFHWQHAIFFQSVLLTLSLWMIRFVTCSFINDSDSTGLWLPELRSQGYLEILCLKKIYELGPWFYYYEVPLCKLQGWFFRESLIFKKYKDVIIEFRGVSLFWAVWIGSCYSGLEASKGVFYIFSVICRSLFHHGEFTLISCLICLELTEAVQSSHKFYIA